MPKLDPLSTIVVCTICLIGLGTFGVCAFHADDIIAGRFKCDPDNRVFDLLMMMLLAIRKGENSNS